MEWLGQKEEKEIVRLDSYDVRCPSCYSLVGINERCESGIAEVEPVECLNCGARFIPGPDRELTHSRPSWIEISGEPARSPVIGIEVAIRDPPRFCTGELE